MEYDVGILSAFFECYRDEFLTGVRETAREALEDTRRLIDLYQRNRLFIAPSVLEITRPKPTHPGRS